MAELQDFQMSIDNIMAMLHNPSKGKEVTQDNHQQDKEERTYTIPDGSLHTTTHSASDSGVGWAAKLVAHKSVMHQETNGAISPQQKSIKDGGTSPRQMQNGSGGTQVKEIVSKTGKSATQSASSTTSRLTSLSLSKVSSTHTGLALDSSVKGKYLNDRTGMFTDRAGKHYTLAEAMTKDLINRDSVVFVNPDNQNMMTLLDAIDRGHVQRTGHYLDPQTGRKMTLGELISANVVVTRETTYTENSSVEEKYEIEAIVDPTTGLTIPVSEAVNRGIFNPEQGQLYDSKSGQVLSVGEAVEKGLIISSCEGLRPSGATPTAQLVKTTKAFNITGALHPTTKAHLTLSEAIAQGIVNREKGVYNDWSSGKELKIQEAVTKGLVMGNEAHVGDNQGSPGDAIVSHHESTYTLTCVYHPGTKEKLSIGKAVKLGILDTEGGIYHDITNGKSMSLSDAIDKGLVQVRKGMHTREQRDKKVSSFHIEDDEMVNEEESWAVTEDVLTETKKWVITWVTDPRTGDKISYNDALLADILDQAAGLYQNPEGVEKMGIAQAIEQGLIQGELTSVNVDEDFFEQFTASADHIESVRDPETGRSITFDQAVARGLIDKASNKFHDPTTNHSMSLTAATRKGYVVKRKPQALSGGQKSVENSPRRKGANGGVTVDVDVTGYSGATSAKVPAVKANGFPANQGIHKQVDDILSRTQMYTKESAISNTEHHMDGYKADWENECVYDLQSGATIPMEEALHTGIVDPQQAKLMRNFYRQMRPNEQIALDGEGSFSHASHYTSASLGQGKTAPSAHLNAYEQRIKKGEVSSQQEMVIKTAPRPADAYSMTVQMSQTTTSESKIGVLTYEQAVRLGLFNIKTGRFRDPITGVSHTFQDAVSRGHIHANGAAIRNLNTGAALGLGEAITKGLIDPETGRLYEQKAKAGGVAVSDCFCGSRMVTLPALNFEDSIKCGLLNPLLGRFTHPQNVEERTLGEAVYMRFIDGKSAVVQDPASGLKYYLDVALKKKIVNSDTGDIHDPETGARAMTFIQALKAGLFETTFDPVTLTVLDPSSGARVEAAHAIKRGLLGGDTCQVYDPEKGKQLPIDEAIHKELVDRQMGMYKDAKGGRRLLVKTAVEMGLVEPIGAPLLHKIKLSESISRVYMAGSTHDSISAPQYTVHRVKQQLEVKDKTPQVAATQRTVEVHDFTSEKTVKIGTPKIPKQPALEICPQDKVLPARPYNFQSKPVQQEPDESVILDRVLEQYQTKTTKKTPPPPKPKPNRDGISNPEFFIKGGDYDFLQTMSDHQEIDDFVPRVTTPSPKKMEWDISLVPPTGGTTTTVTEMETTTRQDKHGHNHPIKISTIERAPPSKTPPPPAKTPPPQRLRDKEIIIIEKEQPTQVHIIGIHIREALVNRYVDLQTRLFTDPVSGEIMTLTEAISRGYVIGSMDEIKQAILEWRSSQTKESTMEYTTIKEFSSVVEKKSDKLSLADALDMKYLDATTGRFIAPHSSNVYMMKEAVERGLIDGESARVADPTGSGRVYDLSEAFSNMLLDNQGFFKSSDSGKRRPFDEAVKRGFVTLTKTGGAINKVTTIKEVKKLSVSYVIHPCTREQISLKSALNQGIVIPGEGLYRNPSTGDAMTIDEALRHGLIKGRILDTRRSTDERVVDSLNIVSKRAQEPRTTGESAKQEVNVRVVRDPTKTFMIQFVTDPRSNKPISPTEAIRAGIIDLSKAEYVNIVTGEVMTFEEAIKRKLLECVDTTLMPPQDLRFNIISVIDPRTKWEISLSQAIINKIINFEKGLYVNTVTGISISIQDAIDQGLIRAEGRVPKGLTSANVPPPPPALKDSTEEFTNSVFVQSQTYTITHAVDTRSGERVTITEALKRGILDEALSIYHDMRTGEEINIQDAIDQNKLIAQLEDEDAKSKRNKNEKSEVKAWVDNAKDSRRLRRTTIYDIDVVIDPETKQEVSVKEAVDRGILNRQTGVYDNNFSIDQAIGEGLIRTRPIPAAETASVSLAAVIDPRTNEKISISDALRHGYVDRAKQEYVHPATGERISLKEAVRRGLAILTPTGEPSSVGSTYWSARGPAVGHGSRAATPSGGLGTLGSGTQAYSICSVIDPRTREELSVDAALRLGLLDRSRRHYINTLSGETLALHEAIRRGLVKLAACNDAPPPVPVHHATSPSVSGGTLLRTTSPPVSSGTLLRDKLTFSEAVDRRLINTQTESFLHPATGQIMSVREAMQQGYIVDEVDSGKRTVGRSTGSRPPRSADQVFTSSQTTTETKKTVKRVGAGGMSPSSPIRPGGGVWDDMAHSGPISLQQAIDMGYICILTGEVTLPQLKQPVSIDDALLSGLITSPVPVTAQSLHIAGPRSLSLTEAFRQGLVKPITLDVHVLETKQWISMEHALRTGYVQPRPTDGLASLQAMLDSPQATGFPQGVPHLLVGQDVYSRPRDPNPHGFLRSNSVPRDTWKVKEVITKPASVREEEGTFRRDRGGSFRSVGSMRRRQGPSTHGTINKGGSMGRNNGQQTWQNNTMNRQEYQQQQQQHLQQQNTLNRQDYQQQQQQHQQQSTMSRQNGTLSRQGASDTLNSHRGGTMPVAFGSPVCHFVNGKLYASRKGFYIDKNGNVINTADGGKLSLKQALINNIVHEIPTAEDDDGASYPTSNMNPYRPWGMDYMLRRYMHQQPSAAPVSRQGFVDTSQPFPSHTTNRPAHFMHPQSPPPSSTFAAYSEPMPNYIQEGAR